MWQQEVTLFAMILQFQFNFSSVMKQKLVSIFITWFLQGPNKNQYISTNVFDVVWTHIFTVFSQLSVFLIWILILGLKRYRVILLYSKDWLITYFCIKYGPLYMKKVNNLFSLGTCNYPTFKDLIWQILVSLCNN